MQKIAIFLKIAKIRDFLEGQVKILPEECQPIPILQYLLRPKLDKLVHIFCQGSQPQSKFHTIVIGLAVSTNGPKTTKTNNSTSLKIYLRKKKTNKINNLLLFKNFNW